MFLVVEINFDCLYNKVHNLLPSWAKDLERKLRLIADLPPLLHSKRAARKTFLKVIFLKGIRLKNFHGLDYRPYICINGFHLKILLHAIKLAQLTSFCLQKNFQLAAIYA